MSGARRWRSEHAIVIVSSTGRTWQRSGARSSRSWRTSASCTAGAIGFRYVGGYLTPDRDYTEQHGRAGALAQAKYLASKLRVRP